MLTLATLVVGALVLCGDLTLVLCGDADSSCTSLVW